MTNLDSNLARHIDAPVDARPAALVKTRRRLVAVGVLVLMLAAVIVSRTVSLPYAAIAPGDAQAVSPLISVPAGKASPSSSRILLTDVAVYEKIKIADWLRYQFDPNVAIVGEGDLTGGLPSSEFVAEGIVGMEESQLVAGAVALRQLGYSVPEHDVGVTVYGIMPRTPAYGTLHVGDVIEAVDGVPTTNPSTFVSVLHQHQPGETVTLSVGTVASLGAAPKSISVRLGSQTVDGKQLPLLGIPVSTDPYANDLGTQPAYDMPFSVSINPDGIGGPSAGLAWTLGILDKLSGGDLTGGRTIAATGTIRPDGTVGDVGGVAQKTIAVERAGASVFFVPPQEVAVARAHASSHLRVLAVSSLAQALDDLAQLCGHLGAAAKGPVSGPGGSSVPTDWEESPWS